MTAKITLVFIVLLCVLQRSFLLEVDLMDTRTATSDVGWIMPQDSEWQEASSPNENGEEQRMLMVCRMQKTKQNNWVRSPFIPVEGSRRIYVEFEFTMRSCEDVPNVATCKETFHLFYYETDRDEATSTFPPWDEETYTKVDTIAADKKFHRGTAETNLEIRNIGPLTKKGIYIALRDTGACMALLHLRVYYKYCESVLQNFARFPQTLVGPEATSLVEANGVCIDNSREDPKNSAVLYCNSNGEWAVPKGQCLCEPGFAPNEQRMSCVACGRGLYKSISGNTACNRCPSYSHSHDYGSTICDCMFGYFRATSDSPNVACTKPPSKPTNFKTVFNQTDITLSWDRPLNDGGRQDIFYRIKCEVCRMNFQGCSPCSNSLNFSPGNTDLRTTEVEVQGLASFSRYKFKVFAENGVSEEARKYGLEVKYAVVTVATAQTKPSKVIGVVARNVQFNSFIVMWSGESSSDDFDIEYEVMISDISNHEPIRLNITTATSTKVGSLTPGRSYIIEVRASNEMGYGDFSDPVFVMTPEAAEETPPSDLRIDDNSNDFIAVVIGVVSGLICAIAILVILFIWRRRRRGSDKQSEIDFEKYPIYTGSTLLSVGNVSTIQKMYVDPTTYEDPHQALSEFTKEIDSAFVKIESIIGAGEFGEVCLGSAILPKSTKPKPVAIKTLKYCSTNQQKLDFLGEASIMGQFDHPNVIRLEGVVTKSRPLMILTEYMENGSLDSYLRKHDGELNVIDLVRMLRNIGCGMKYLSGMGYVHRDLAARNILVNSQLVCKVSDFGMSRVLEDDDDDATYTTKGGKIPIRWTAPEAITFRKFTSAGDVWSYGIVMWEVMSYGERPYWEMTNRDVIQAISSEYRLPAPMDCPLVLHQIMLDCWKKNRTERPKFIDIVAMMDGILREPTQLRLKAGLSGNSNGRLIPAAEGLHLPTITEKNKLQNPDKNVAASPTPAEVSFLGVLLERIGLSSYKDNFLQCGCYSIEQIRKLNLNDLCKLGITNTNDQTTLFDEIYAIKQENETYKEDNGQGISV